MSLHCFFSGCMPLLSHSLFIKKKPLYPFSQRTKVVFPVLALMVEFCVGITTVEALELVRVFSQAKNFMKLSRFQRAIFQAAPQVFVGVCPVGLWDCGMADVERIPFTLFPANICMKTILGFGLELQACVSRK